MTVKTLARQMVEFYEKLSNWEHEVVRGSELTTGQMHAIEIIGHERSLRMKELAEKLGVTTGTLTVTVDKLERKGLLERRRHESDRRSYRVELTPAGEKHFASHHEYHLKLTEEIVSTLSADELECFRKVLEKMLKQF
ncbi:MAG: MarR family transcriptional regulator [Desulfuromonadales bacterium]|nr:MarR family transcriptional regulator [Desulfuromonadales bacterium]NIS42833.1 MarR family transcriptional regulator [Desulfuromonadales bacterium]